MDQFGTLAVCTLPGLPLFAPGMAIADEILRAAAAAGEGIGAGDVVVAAQKIVSKAEGRFAVLADVEPGEEARAMAGQTARDPAMVQLILDESAEVLRARPEAIIARHRSGHVLANAGIDASNVEGEGRVLLWPEDADASARAIRAGLRGADGLAPAVIIADSLGRAWRIGTLGAAIGCAGIMALDDQRGKGTDMFGRTLQATVIAVADAIAAMATLAMGEGDEGTPVAIVRGAGKWISREDGPGAGAGLRPLEQDMFR